MASGIMPAINGLEAAPVAAYPDQPLVLFDAGCPLCVDLAQWAERRADGALRFASWDDFRASVEGEARLSADELAQPGDRLKVLTAAGLIEGDAAWAFLVEAHPALRGLDWLAGRIGLLPLAAKALRTAGDLLRAFCSRCRR